MKKIFLILPIIALTILGCDGNDEQKINNYLKTAKKPIMTKWGVGTIAAYNLTLIDARGKVLHLQNTSIILPDTIK